MFKRKDSDQSGPRIALTGAELNSGRILISAKYFVKLDVQIIANDLWKVYFDGFHDFQSKKKKQEEKLGLAK